MGLTTVLGLAPGGFFIPYRYAAELGAAERRTLGTIAATFAELRADFAAVVDLIDDYRVDLLAIAADADAEPPPPKWCQDWFAGLDAALLYTLIRHHRPRRVFEIGCGHSTRFVARAVADGGLATEITAIDPAPRATIDGLPVRVLHHPVQQIDPAAFAAMEAGDVLIVDSSHVLMPGSDVDVILNDILPRLSSGVLVHVHDVFLPDPYPAAWRWRGYNEQVAVAPMIGPDGPYRPLFASRYARRWLADRLARSVVDELPRPAGAIESSLWLRKNPSGALAAAHRDAQRRPR